MTLQLKSLDEMKKDLEARGWNVKDWAGRAGIHWQALYRRIASPDKVTLGEHIKLQDAWKQLKQGRKA